MAAKFKGGIELTDGSAIAVIGGGPAGSFFSYYAMEYAKRFDLDIHIDIYEAKDFTKIGASGCNHCGGIVSESLVQQLATDGIVIPDKIIQKGINSYTLHMEQGVQKIDTPSMEHRIASVFRGCGPKGCTVKNSYGFDNYLLQLCHEKGAEVIRSKVSALGRAEDGITVRAGKADPKKYDLVVGAVGLNQKTLELFKAVCPGYVLPETTRAYICEFQMEQDAIDLYFQNSMHVFLLDLPRITFGALIPKQGYVTLVLLGEEIDKEVVATFLQAEQVRSCFPDDFKLETGAPCKCYPMINVKAAENVFDDRVVLIGDSASSKLYKNGIGAAFITARSAASTSIFEGIDKRTFERYYKPSCTDLDRDNMAGKFIFWFTKLIQKSSMSKMGILRMVAREQQNAHDVPRMSSALWDTFTGSAGYRNILKRFLNPKLLGILIWNCLTNGIKFNYKIGKQKNSKLGHLYKDGEVIIKQGSVGNCLYVVQKGRVEVISESEIGEVKVAELGKTEFFGEMGLFESDVRSCTVRAVGDARVLTIDKKNFYRSIHQDSSLAYRLLEKMSERLREANKRIVSE